MDGKTQNIKIGLVDDHKLFKTAMRAVLTLQYNIQIVLDANNGKDLIEKLGMQQPDVLMLDLIMPVMGGLEVLPIITKKYPQMKVIVLSLYNDEAIMQEVVKLGACGYLLKTEAPSQMIHQIQICIRQCDNEA